VKDTLLVDILLGLEYRFMVGKLVGLEYKLLIGMAFNLEYILLVGMLLSLELVGGMVDLADRVSSGIISSSCSATRVDT